MNLLSEVFSSSIFCSAGLKLPISGHKHTPAEQYQTVGTQLNLINDRQENVSHIDRARTYFSDRNVRPLPANQASAMNITTTQGRVTTEMPTPLRLDLDTLRKQRGSNVGLKKPQLALMEEREIVGGTTCTGKQRLLPLSLRYKSDFVHGALCLTYCTK